MREGREEGKTFDDVDEEEAGEVEGMERRKER